ncbi:hypothetical protein B6V73_12995 [Thioclava sp. JM3]|uniref:Uncharacterized protein n=2 Tax=Paracoccaceae TaxID=31989 RepID=A0ABN4XI49_9RHOB|nr:hypothetical protein BMG03_17260 [Thioclava nitratireducens]OWY03443.1 hypothetical protein B6V76_10475 [Thioclava sp. IC9]OWY03993.1 hypothetical protein B6V75_09480 [Thioclava sp. F1Mire-8]OWY10215.1 hypothetical protein B6V74_06205 [Thioclava sp. F42-5]OWY14826.1 hypothetical protein B6V72_04160 [Thioclava sp. F34-6]OWY16274.1 hypothetical protein B6V73_12995 [Thioclava sp. JM3]PWE51989.1 hypothetical protein DEM26_02070 [Thioclava sp. NG1]
MPGGSHPPAGRPRLKTRFPGAPEWIALGLSILWVFLVAAFWFFAPGIARAASLFATVSLVVGMAVPIVMVWVAAVTARATREMRAETAALRQSIEAMRTAWLNQQAMRTDQNVEKKLDEIAAVARQAETTIATFASRRDVQASQPSADRKAALVAPPPPRPDDSEPMLALGTPAEDLRAPLSVADFVRALNFPDSPDDTEGFRALRRALEDRSTAKLLRSAQDVLNLLAQDGIYMDDLKPDRARPELWRRFAQGERGREITSLGGIRDRSSLALSAGRMRGDTIFRDVAHHFLRQFDRTFAEFEKNASDQDIAEMAETRTARAFMLLGRVTGSFD